MACRLHNRSQHPLRVDLRGGKTLQLAPGETSAPLREELLYDNMFLPQWEREGLVMRLPARFAEVLEREAGAKPAAAAAPTAKKESAAARGGAPGEQAERATPRGRPAGKSSGKPAGGKSGK